MYTFKNKCKDLPFPSRLLNLECILSNTNVKTFHFHQDYSSDGLDTTIHSLFRRRMVIYVASYVSLHFVYRKVGLVYIDLVTMVRGIDMRLNMKKS